MTNDELIRAIKSQPGQRVLVAERFTTTNATSYRRGASDKQIEMLSGMGFRIERERARTTHRGLTRSGVAVYAMLQPAAAVSRENYGAHTLPLPVTYHVGALAVPATVTRLLKPYFEVVVSEYVSEGGNLRPAETFKLDYRGAPYGTQGRRVPKKYQSRTPPRALPGVYGKDLAAVRVLSGRSPY